jgi:hypothetical protein
VQAGLMRIELSVGGAQSARVGLTGPKSVSCRLLPRDIYIRQTTRREAAGDEWLQRLVSNAQLSWSPQRQRGGSPLR